MSEKIKSAWPHIAFKVCVFVALIVTCCYLLIYGFSTEREYHFGFKETGDIDYVVNLRDGNFLNEKSLQSGEVYYADSIESIDAAYKYGADFTDAVTGDYTYYLYATVTATESNGDTLWSNTTQITEAVTKHISNSKKLRISTKQLVRYPEYDQIMKNFAEQYHATKGELKIYLSVKGDFAADIMDRPVELNSSINLSVPLTKEAVTISVATDTKNDGKIYTKKVNIDSDRHRFCRFAGALIGFALIYLTVAMIQTARAERKQHYYEYSVNRLREEYDSIIVDLKEPPKITKLHIAHVQGFDELLDVYNSIKQPINYYEAKDGAHFILINGRLAWQFVLPKEKKTKKTAPKRRVARRRK